MLDPRWAGYGFDKVGLTGSNADPLVLLLKVSTIVPVTVLPSSFP
jgi:hypothetical protein